jgi:hypothetical protein
MIRTRHYNRNGANRKRTRLHPDAELERNIAERGDPTATPYVDAQHLRGIGCVIVGQVSKYTQPKRVRRNDGYIAANGAWIATPEAGYLEFARDCNTLARKQRKYNRKVSKGKVNMQTERDIALMAKIGTITEGQYS